MTAAEDHDHLLCVIPDTILIHKSSPSQVAIRACRQDTQVCAEAARFRYKANGETPFWCTENAALACHNTVAELR